MPFSFATGEVIDQGAREYTVPPGRYVLGDPCYTFPADQWLELLVSCDHFRAGPGKAAGLEVVAFDTAYGDGTYTGSDDFDYPVDAGLIGLVPFFDNIYIDSSLVTVLEFIEPTVCSTDGKGRLKFGDVSINTYDEDESPDDTDYPEDDGVDWADVAWEEI